MAETYHSALELAGLPGMPGTQEATCRRAKRESWPSRPRSGRGGGREYPFSCLPEATRAAILEGMTRAVIAGPECAPAAPPAPAVPADPEPVSALPARVAKTSAAVAVASPACKSPAVYVPKSDAELKDWQRRRRDARIVLLRVAEEWAQAVGWQEAFRKLEGLAGERDLPEEILRQIPLANARSGGEAGLRTVSVRTLWRWKADLSEGGATQLAPKRSCARKDPVWVPILNPLWHRPQKPSVSEVYKELLRRLPEGIETPSYHQVLRYLNNLSPVEREKQRMGKRALKGIRPYIQRDTSMFMPRQIVVMDGHTFDAYVGHFKPPHKPFRPEHTTVVDVVTRKALGLSVNVAESAIAVLDGLSHAILKNGLFSILYVDRGSGYRNKMIGDEVVGFLARMGITLKHSIAYNSQARGIIERFHRTVWVTLAKTYPTYMGEAMDPEARQLADRILKGKVDGAAPASILPDWAFHLRNSAQAMEIYNDTPHSALPKFRAPATGKVRPMTPNEYEATFLEKGWAPMTVSAEEAVEMFRPHELRKVGRGMVSLNGNSYFHKGLAEYHGHTVRVGYDQFDPSRVWIRDQDGVFLCVAQLDGNKHPYMPLSVVEAADAKRVRERIRRAEGKVIRIREEEGLLEIEGELVESEPLSPELLAAANRQYAALAEARREREAEDAVVPEAGDAEFEEAAFEAPAAGDTSAFSPSVEATKPEAPSPDIAAPPKFASEIDWGKWAIANRNALTQDQRDFLDERLESPTYRFLVGYDPDKGFSTAPGGDAAGPEIKAQEA